jgi:hypothetical protein
MYSRICQAYSGNLSFATDAWTSPNHKAFVAVSVHFEQSGKPVCLILDVVEVAKVRISINTLSDSSETHRYTQSHSGYNLAAAFAQILDEFGISEKVSNMTHRDRMSRC